MGRCEIHFEVQSTKLADGLAMRSEGKRRIDQLDEQMEVSFMRWGRLGRRHLGVIEESCL